MSKKEYLLEIEVVLKVLSITSMLSKNGEHCPPVSHVSPWTQRIDQNVVAEHHDANI